MADYLADPRKAYGFCGLGALQRPQVLRHNSSNYGGVLFTDPRKRGENASKAAQLAGGCVLTIMAEYFARATDGVSAKREEPGDILESLSLAFGSKTCKKAPEVSLLE